MYWRVFAADDTTFAFGLADGILQPDQTAVIEAPGHAKLKLEVKRDGLLGRVLLAAGPVWEAGARFEVASDGSVAHVETLPPLLLPLHNDLDGPMYWCTFLRSDTTLAAGLAEGVIKARETAARTRDSRTGLPLATRGTGSHNHRNM